MSSRPIAVAALSILAAVAAVAAGRPASELDLWFALAGEPEWRAEVVAAATADLERTPLRHRVRFAAPEELPQGAWPRPVLALVEARRGDPAAATSLELARAEGAVSPGWLVHAALRALDAVGDPPRRQAVFGQLVARSTRRLPPPAIDTALAAGVPALGLNLPSADPQAAAGRLAAVARRLGALEGHPRFEDEYLVVGRRVWLRRDLYWLGLGLWLLLFWRGRGRPGRAFRWLFLLAWLLAPAFAAPLLTLPALVAAWSPTGGAGRRAWALVPLAVFAGMVVAELAGGARPVVAFVPAVLFTAACAAYLGFVDVARGRRPVGDEESPVTV